MLAEAEEVDAAEDERFGDARGDELPAELADPVTRRERLERAKREMEAEQAARVGEHEAMLARRAAYRQRTGRNRRGRPPGDGLGAGAAGRRQAQHHRPDSRIMHAGGALDAGLQRPGAGRGGKGDHRRRRHAARTTATSLSRCSTRHARTSIRSATRRRSSACSPTAATGTTITSTTARKDTVVVIPTSDPHNTQRKYAPRQGAEADRINKILKTPAGKRLYRRRAAMVEPVFAHTKHTRAITASAAEDT